MKTDRDTARRALILLRTWALERAVTRADRDAIVFFADIAHEAIRRKDR